MVISREQQAGQHHSMMKGDRFSERVEQFKCLVTTLTNQSYVQEEIESSLKSGNDCYHSVSNIFFQFTIQKYKD